MSGVGAGRGADLGRRGAQRGPQPLGRRDRSAAAGRAGTLSGGGPSRYAPSMAAEALPGELVKVATGGPELNGIVFDRPSRSKVVVAIVDRSRGPVLRTFAATALTLRETESPDDRALQLLIRRTPASGHDAARGG